MPDGIHLCAYGDKYEGKRMQKSQAQLIFKVHHTDEESGSF